MGKARDPLPLTPAPTLQGPEEVRDEPLALPTPTEQAAILNAACSLVNLVVYIYPSPLQVREGGGSIGRHVSALENSVI